MSFWDDLGNFANDVLHGNVGGAVHDVGQGIHDALGGSSGTGSGAGSTSMIPGLQAEQALQALANARAAAAKATTAARGVQGGTPAAPCCNRYNLNSGFLVDGVTGSVWQFDANSKTFEQVPVNYLKPKQTLVDTVIENQLNVFKGRYEAEFLNTVPLAMRPKLLPTFDTEHLALLRDVAKTILY